MFGAKFTEFFDSLLLITQNSKMINNHTLNNQNKINETNSEDENNNEYNLNQKSILYLIKEMETLITNNLSIKQFLEKTNNSQKYSYYLKILQNIYCNISELVNLFPSFKPLKLVLKFYFLVMRTYYYNNQKLEKIFISNKNFMLYIDYFFKEIFIYSIKIFPNIIINNEKNNAHNLNINEEIKNIFLGNKLPFDKENNIIKIPFNILYNNSDYRHDIMKEIVDNGVKIENFFEKQNIIFKEGNDVVLNIFEYFLREIKEDKYLVDKFIKYLELNDEDKKAILNKIKK